MKNCYVCGSEKTSEIKLDVESVHVCGVCGYGYPTLRTPIEYDEAYEAKYLKYPEDEINKIRIKAVYKTVCSVKNNVEVKEFLDYGCGSGSFVGALRDAGFSAFGVDVNDFTAHLRPSGYFYPDVVTAWDSFEHMADEEQTEFFEKLESSLTSVVVVSLPDFSTPAKDETLKAWRHYRPGEHLHYYTELALVRRFADEGFIPVYVSHEEDTVRKAPWENNILTVGFVHESVHRHE